MGSTSPSIFSSRTTGLTACSSADAEGKRENIATAPRAAKKILRATDQSPWNRARCGFIVRLRWTLALVDAPAIVSLRSSWAQALGRAAPRHAPDRVFSARGRYG